MQLDPGHQHQVAELPDNLQHVDNWPKYQTHTLHLQTFKARSEMTANIDSGAGEGI